jgi:glycosyltransferase involved in cell wall biosynthesis
MSGWPRNWPGTSYELYEIFRVKTALIITTYNWPQALRRVLDSVMLQSRMPDELIIADDGSGPETRALVDGYRPKLQVPLIHSWQEDLGFRAARSRNLAISRASADYLILIDGDMILHSNFIEDHIRFARQGFWVQGVRAKLSPNGSQELLLSESYHPIKTWDARLKSKRYSIRSQFLRSLFSGRRYFAKLAMAQTCNLALFREDCIKVNGFNEDFIGWGREDGEFVCRLMNAGTQRRDFRFSGVAYHIHHEGNSRASLDQNHRLYLNTVENQLTWCENGLNQHLSRNNDSTTNHH